MAFIITNITESLPAKNPQYKKDLSFTIKDQYGGENNIVVSVSKPLILSGTYLPKQFHMYQIKGFISITPISELQYEFLKEEQNKPTLPEKHEESPTVDEKPKISSKTVSKKNGS